MASSRKFELTGMSKTTADLYKNYLGTDKTHAPLGHDRGPVRSGNAAAVVLSKSRFLEVGMKGDSDLALTLDDGYRGAWL